MFTPTKCILPHFTVRLVGLTDLISHAGDMHSYLHNEVIQLITKTTKISHAGDMHSYLHNEVIQLITKTTKITEDVRMFGCTSHGCSPFSLLSCLILNY